MSNFPNKLHDLVYSDQYKSITPYGINGFRIINDKLFIIESQSFFAITCKESFFKQLNKYGFKNKYGDGIFEHEYFTKDKSMINNVRLSQKRKRDNDQLSNNLISNESFENALKKYESFFDWHEGIKSLIYLT